jgi:hypothetical protein
MIYTPDLRRVPCLARLPVQGIPSRATPSHTKPNDAYDRFSHIASVFVQEQSRDLVDPALAVLASGHLLAGPAVFRAASASASRVGVSPMFHSNVDTIMFGCLLALLWKEPAFREWTARWVYSARGTLIAGGAFVFLPVLDPLLAHYLRGGYWLMVGMTLEGISICFMMLYVVDRPQALPGRLLNTRLLRGIGVISYRHRQLNGAMGNIGSVKQIPLTWQAVEG